MGDPAGVGPELCLQLLTTTSVLEECHPVIFGDLSAIQKTAAQMGINFPECAIVKGDLTDPPLDAPATFVDLANDAGVDLVAGQISAQNGQSILPIYRIRNCICDFGKHRCSRHRAHPQRGLEDGGN